MKDRVYLYTPCSTGAQALEWLDPWDIMSTGARYPHNSGIPKSQRELELGNSEREQGRIHVRVLIFVLWWYMVRNNRAASAEWQWTGGRRQGRRPVSTWRGAEQS